MSSKKRRKGQYGKPPERWGRNDIVGSGGERFYRWEIDRGVMTTEWYWEGAASVMGLGGASPLMLGARTAGETRRLRVLDAACGTGHLLRCLIDEIRNMPGCQEADIRGVGVNHQDYSGLSLNDETRAAYGTGRGHRPDLDYVVAEVEEMTADPRVGTGVFDIVISQEALAYAQDPSQWLRQMMAAARVGGRLYFTAPPMMYGRDPRIHRVAHEWRSRGADVQSALYTIPTVSDPSGPDPVSPQSDMRLFATVEKPFGMV